MVFINGILPLKKLVDIELRNTLRAWQKKLKQNNTQNPIELKADTNGSFFIHNGNHRLEIANKLGIKEVPIKFIESLHVDKDDKTNYHNNNEYEIVSVANEKFQNTKEVRDNNDRSKFGLRYEENDNAQLAEKKPTNEYDKLSNILQGHNDKSSSTTARGKIIHKNEDLTNRGIVTPIKNSKSEKKISDTDDGTKWHKKRDNIQGLQLPNEVISANDNIPQKGNIANNSNMHQKYFYDIT